MQVREYGIAFKFYHRQTPEKEYDYKSDVLFDIIESLCNAQKANKTRYNANELKSAVAKIFKEGILTRDTFARSSAVKEIFDATGQKAMDLVVVEQFSTSMKAVEDETKKMVKEKRKERNSGINR